MIEKTVFAGFGGQGIISLGQIWVYCGMKEGKEVTFFPFYGAEKRGGIARANCIVSDEPIASPLITGAGSVVVMNQESLSSSISVLSSGALMLVNSSLVSLDTTEEGKKAKERFRIVSVKANDIAEKLGNIKTANMVMLGALARLTGALSLDTVEQILESFFPASKHKFIPMNVASIREGMTVRL